MWKKIFVLLFFYLTLPRNHANIHFIDPVLKESPRLDNVYECFYAFDEAITKDTKRRIFWVFNYLAMGSNIIFLPATKEMEPHLDFKQNDDCRFSYRDIMIGKGCNTLRHIIQRILFVIGIVPEITYPNSNNWQPTEQMGSQTFQLMKRPPYKIGSEMDVASITFDVDAEPSFFFLHRNGFIKPLQSTTNTFLLSSCDWYALSELYPGRKEPPECSPGSLPESLIPTKALLDKMGQFLAERECATNYNSQFLARNCVFPNGRIYPTLSWLESPLILPSATLPPEPLNHFCSLMKDLFTSDGHNCHKQCIESCPRRYPQHPIRFCMKYRFMSCFQQAKLRKLRLQSKARS